eukprot:Blabericola_migrator_1__1726@NODE_1464_length_4502_cov_13_265614_g964_i0_p2_GENE_NODE_1464_length_4502_cov_13_265614_g964_i0NODE_1464_length_4502_cov_13_265614_g964_i0_p2_ORF_typecomplete_len312_score63_35XAP5/PF04921_14/1_3e03XAP5/PF04921_14/3_9e34DUF5567/PF17722_1/0_35DUF5567/PF17722_1/1_9e03Phage_HK97_TLTM/PF06120_11/5_9_NODE_1464_length_4502_cov_13_265614_g964_i034884423
MSSTQRELKALQDKLKGKSVKETGASQVETRKRLLRQYEAASKAEQLEEEFKRETIGLRTVDEYRLKRSRIVNAEESMQEGSDVGMDGEPTVNTVKALVNTNVLSFADLDEEEDTYESEGGRLVLKDPLAVTKFLPDASRQSELSKKRDELKAEYESETAKEKAKMVEVEFFIWNAAGKGHKLKIPKDTTLVDMLKKLAERKEALAALDATSNVISNSAHSSSSATVKTEHLMVVKDGNIIPVYLTFYELQRDQIKNTQGTVLFGADDASDTIDVKERSPPSKFGMYVVDKRWYDKNRHIYPLSTWENLAR